MVHLEYSEGTQKEGGHLMNVQRVYKSKEDLTDRMKLVDTISQIDFNLQNMSLEITITSSSEDQLFLKLSEFINYDDAAQLLADDSFLLY